MNRFALSASSGLPESAMALGFRTGAKGTHSSRTMMLAELQALLAASEPNTSRDDYTTFIVNDNCLGKPTTATRRLTSQRLSELYGLDPAIPVFGVLRRLWHVEPRGGALLALHCAIARDPLFAASLEPVLSLAQGAELPRDAIRLAVGEVTAGRLNPATLDKVARNAASSWTQSGHLVGRTFKRRARVEAFPVNVAYGLFLAHGAGFRGGQLFSCGWMAIIDCDPWRAQELALEAKRLGLIDLRIAGDVVDVGLERLAV